MMRIKQAIAQHMDTMPPSERKVARALLANYPSAGLESANALAKAAGTSAPTVLRLVSRLGLASYAEFQTTLRDEVMLEMNSPLHRAEQRRLHSGPDADLGQFVARRRELVERTASTVSSREFERAAELLAEEPRSVLFAGGYYSRLIAEIMARQLDQIIPNVEFLADPLGYDIGKFYAARKNSVVVLFDFRRYQLAGQQMADLARNAHATLIVITDEGVSPSADHADVVLTVPVDGSPFDSFAGVLVLVESLVEAVFQRTGERGIRRMKMWEERSLMQRADIARPDQGGRS